MYFVFARSRNRWNLNRLAVVGITFWFLNFGIICIICECVCMCAMCMAMDYVECESIVRSKFGLLYSTAQFMRTKPNASNLLYYITLHCLTLFPLQLHLQTFGGFFFQFSVSLCLLFSSFYLFRPAATLSVVILPILSSSLYLTAICRSRVDLVNATNRTKSK